MGTLFTRCAKCGKMFTPYRQTQKYCSDKCRNAVNDHLYKYKRKPIVTKKCIHCGKEFESNDNKRRYCCKECYKEHQLAYHPEPVPKTRPCVECGTSFTTTHPHKKYCCKECYATAKVRREKRTPEELVESKERKTKILPSMMIPKAFFEKEPLNELQEQ